MRVLQLLETEVRLVNEANGWHETEREFGTGMALIHSEVSEALEAYRDHGYADFSSVSILVGRPGPSGYRAGTMSALRKLDRQTDGVRDWADTKPIQVEEPDPFTKDELYDMAADGIAKPEGVGSELADVVIRVLDEVDRARRQGVEIDLEWEIERKLAYNRTRGHRHGGKRV